MKMKTTAQLRKMKENGEKITMITAYDAPSAKLAEEAGIDTILVGDSLGMVVLGYDTTVPVTVDDMIHHTKAVKRGAKDTFVITDLPFLSYHASLDEMFRNARRMVQEGGADAVKIEGDGKVLDYAAELIQAGVPVAAHLGLTPQSVGVLGGYKVQGKSEDEAEKLLREAKRADEIGVCLLVLECVPEGLAAKISKEICTPVIGIGAGRYTDGQVLVYHDTIGYTQGHVPKFVKQYCDVSESILRALTQYNEEVKSGAFPEKEHVFQALVEGEQKLYGGK